MKKSNSFWKNSWTISIGSGLVILAITVIIDMITAEKVFNTIKSTFSFAVKCVLAFLNLELKMWWLLIGVSALLFALWLYVKYQDSKQPEHAKPQFLEYTQDTLLGHKWKWTWEQNWDGKYRIEDLHPICMKCSTPLTYDRTGYGRLKCLRCDAAYQYALPDESDIKMLIYDNVERQCFPTKQ